MLKSSPNHPILASPFWSRLMFNHLHLSGLEKKIPQLLPSKKFRSELELEMLRSDRTGSPMTLILFDLESGQAQPEEREAGLLKLAQLIGQESRLTDHKGWYHDDAGLHVALMLLHTLPERAHRIITVTRNRFREAMSQQKNQALKTLDLACAIYAYPIRPERLEEDEAHTSHPGEEAGGGNGAAGRDPEGAAGPDSMQIRPQYPSAHLLLRRRLPVWKRSFDLIASLIGLLIIFPLFLLIALLIKLTSPGPVFFKQERVGYLGKIFRCWKFRSMRVDADPTAHKQYLSQLIEQAAGEGDKGADKPMIKLDSKDKQITVVGRILRKSCLDELPQLFNVLRGEMSLVGPRPCLPYEVEKYQRWHLHRLDAVPGITGLWQVMGKNKTTFKQMIRLDILYARQRCLWLDIKILFLTIPAVLREIQQVGHLEEVK